MENKEQIDVLNQFSRTELLLGHEGMEKLSKARVAVFGIGGVGGYTVEALARSGVGTLDLIDDDKVCLTNLNRQIIATRSTVGKYKVDVAAERIHDINPDAVVNTYKTFYNPETASQFDFTQYDYVVDAIDTVTGKIELVENCPVDTLERDGRRLKLRKRYRLAAFDEGKYNLGAAQVLYADKNILDTLRSTDSVYLEVATFQIDSTSQSIYDLKAQKNLPFRFREVSGYVKWGVFFLLMLLAAGYALKRYLASRGKGFGDLFKPAPPLPPHVAAIQALEALHNQKLWQNNRHKQYYSGLTDILRTYIAARWGFGAMEMTSDEIIETMRPEELPDKARMDLTAILRDADLVKFAKATPEAEQNEADYLKAYYFVEETKPVEEEAPAEEESPKQN